MRPGGGSACLGPLPETPCGCQVWGQEAAARKGPSGTRLPNCSWQVTNRTPSTRLMPSMAPEPRSPGPPTSQPGGLSFHPLTRPASVSLAPSCPSAGPSPRDSLSLRPSTESLQRLPTPSCSPAQRPAGPLETGQILSVTATVQIHTTAHSATRPLPTFPCPRPALATPASTAS